MSQTQNNDDEIETDKIQLR